MDERLLEIADFLEPQLQAEFLDAIQGTEAKLEVEAILKALQDNDIELALALIREWLGTSSFTPEPIQSTTHYATWAAALLAATWLLRNKEEEPVAIPTIPLPKIPGVSQALSTTLDNWATSNAGLLTQQVNEATRNAAGLVIARSLENGIEPKITARTLPSIVGLLDQHVRALFRYQERLIGEGIPPDRVIELTEIYGNRLKRWRAMMIARTETMRAANMGQLIVWRDMIDSGILDATAISLRWVVTPDDRLCQYCAPMDGQTVEWGKQFESRYRDTSIKSKRGKSLKPDPFGAKRDSSGRFAKALVALPPNKQRGTGEDTNPELWAPPLHPMCRCVVVLETT